MLSVGGSMFGALVIFVAVFAFSAIRKVGTITLPLWGIMGAGALAMLATGSISPRDAY